MALAVVEAVNSGYQAPANHASWSVTFGATPANGETILLISAMDAGNPWDTPTGFTLEETETYDGPLQVWSRVASSEASATYTVSAASEWRHGDMFGVRLSGGDATTVMEAEAKDLSYSATQTAPSVTTLTDNAWHLAIWKLKNSTDATAEAAPAGYTKIDGLRNCLFAYKTITPAGASGTAAVTLTPTNGWIAMSFAVKPGAAGGTPTGTASVSGTGTVSATGVRTAVATASVTGTGTVSSTGQRTTFGTVSISGGGTVTSSGVPTRFGTASVAGTGSISATGNISGSPTGTASVSGTCTISATGVRTAVGTTSVTGIGSITSTGQRTTFAVMTITGTGQVGSTGSRTTFGTASVVGAGSIAAEGSVPGETTGTLMVLGSSVLSFTGRVPAPAPTPLSLTFALDGSRTRAVPEPGKTFLSSL